MLNLEYLKKFADNSAPESLLKTPSQSIKNLHLENKFILSILGIPVALVKDVSLPSYTIETEKHWLLNHAINFPKKIHWESITLNFAEIFEAMSFLSLAGNSSNVSSVLMNYLGTLQTAASAPETSNILSKERMAKLSSLSLDNIKPDGSIAFSWILDQPIITKANFGKNSYSSDGIFSLSCTIEYDWANLVIR